MATGKNDQLSKRQPTSRRLSRVRSSKRRVKKFRLWLGFSDRLTISFRRFHTNKARRSKRYRQLVFPVKLFATREIAVAVTKNRRRPKVSQARLIDYRLSAAAFLITVGISGALFFGWHFTKPVKLDIKPSQAAAIVPPIQPVSKTMASSLPTRLQIPKIGMYTQLAQTGLSSNGSIQMPWDIYTAAWYNHSPTPGEIGPAVIVGHLDGADYANLTGIFWRLHELLPGDQITVDRADGTVANFKVILVKNVSQTNFPTQEVYGNINYAGIRLITCGGSFDTNLEHYTDNTVVYGALE